MASALLPPPRRRQHFCETHAHEVYPYEIYTREMHVHEMHAYEMHAREIYAHCSVAFFLFGKGGVVVRVLQRGVP
jgi:hypothetical protein